MNKRFLALMMSLMCLLGMNAQQEIMWEDPTGQYHTETVVYATVLVNNQPSSNILYPAIYNEGDWKIGAFVNGELRDIVEPYDYVTAPFPSGNIQQRVDAVEYTEDGSKLMAVYTFRIGGDVDLDNNANIEFKVLSGGNIYKTHLFNASVIAYNDASILNEAELYSSQTGATISSELQIQWGGDVTLNQPNDLYYLVYSPASYIKSEPETIALDLHLGDPAVNLKEKFESFKYYAQDGTEVAGPIEGGYWEYESEYLMFEGDNVSAIAKPQDGEPVIATYIGGTFIRPDGCVAEITILDPWVNVENIMVEDVTLFKGQSLLRPEVIFNNGETIPTETGYTMVSDNTDIVKIVNGALEPVGIGETTVTITSVGTNSDGNTVSHTFAVNVRSAIDNYGFWVNDEFVNEKLIEVWHETEDFDLSNYLGSPEVIISEELTGDIMFNVFDYTMECDDTDVVRLETNEYGEQRAYAIKKGVATITFTNAYDPAFTATVVVTVKQVPSSIEFISYSINGGDEQLFANLTSNALEAGIDQPITIKARISPEDADFDEGSFIMELMRAEDIGEIVTPSTVEGNECTITVKGVATGLFILKAEAQYTREEEPMTISKNIYIQIKQSVTDIEVAEETTLWIHSNGQTFDFPITVLPETASIKDLNFTYEPIGDTEFGETSPIDIYLGDEGYMLTAMKKAAVKVIATSVDNPAVSKTFNVYIKRQVDGIVFETDGETSNINMYNDGQEYNVYVRILPADADFVEEEFKLFGQYNEDNFGGEDEWEAFDYYLLNVVQTPTTEEADGEYYYNYRIMGKALCPRGFVMSASYSGVEQGMPVEKIAGIDITVNEKINVPTGWSWISLISGTHTTNIVDLVEARSQHELVYNDPIYGFFGDFTTMYPMYDAYKLDMAESFVMYPTYEADFTSFMTGNSPSVTLNTGWNWIGYPYEYSYMASEVFDASQFSEGDLILSKNSGLAALKNGEWENDFTLEPNTGYMVYHNGEEISADLPGRFDMPQGAFYQPERAPRRSADQNSVWSYDGSRFANTMAIIGRLEISDDASDYSIGAFVDDECRGEGRVVNGTAYITVAGEAGEIVSFRLYNTWTGQYVDVITQLEFTDLAGSVKAPIALRAPIVTGIETAEMSDHCIYFSGNVLHLGNYDGIATIMTVDGKVVATTHESAISIEELPVGVYVVIVDSEEGRKVEKIVKN